MLSAWFVQKACFKKQLREQLSNILSTPQTPVPNDTAADELLVTMICGRLHSLLEVN